MIERTCQHCGKKFRIKKSQVKIGGGIYCSNNCQFAAQKNGRYVLCHVCGKKVYKSRSRLKRSKSKKYFCTKKCQTIWRNKYFSGKKHPNFKHGENCRYRGKMIENGVKRKCKICGIEDERILDAHHIDNDPSNNTLENLIWLCKNCHYLVHRYKVKI